MVHGGDAEHHRRRPGQLGRHRLGREALQVVDGPAEAQRPEHPQDQPVDMEQRQRMGEDVVAGPFPGGGQGVEVE